MWINSTDINNRWTSADNAPSSHVVDARIVDAETLVRWEFPDIDDRLAEDGAEPLLERVRFVVTQMVLRVLRNPEGVRSRTSQTGPFSETTTIGGDDPGSPWMTAEERSMLSRSPGSPRPSAFSVDLAPATAMSQFVAGGGPWYTP